MVAACGLRTTASRLPPCQSAAPLIARFVMEQRDNERDRRDEHLLRRGCCFLFDLGEAERGKKLLQDEERPF